MSFAGTPAYTELLGTFFVTTAPAAIIEFSSIVTPCNIVTLAPIHTLSFMIIGFGIIVPLFAGLKL